MHPVSFDAAYEIERNRLTTFFRLIVLIPWIIWLFIYGIAAAVVVIIAWFALLFTKRYPQGMYRFVSGYLRASTRVAAFALLMTDKLPPFSGKVDTDYPITVDVAPPAAEYRRSRTFFKYFTMIPQFFVATGLGYVMQYAAFVSWVRIVFTGKQSITMHDALRGSLAYAVRSHGFGLLVTEVHPRMLDLPFQAAPAGAPAVPAAEQLPQAAAAAVPPPPAVPPTPEPA